MASADASGRKRHPRAPGRSHRDEDQSLGALSEGPEYGVSWLDLHRLGIRVEFADQRIPVIFCRSREMGDEGFDQIPTGFFESFGAAEVRGVGLHKCGVEIKLPNQKAKLVPESGLAVTGTISVARNRRGLLGM